VTPTAPPAAADPPLEWRVHLARAQPRRLPWLALALFGAGAAAYWLFHSLPLALVAAGALASATAEFLLPIRYRLTDELVESRNGLSIRRLRWSEVRRACLLEDGIYLSPLPRPSRLDAYRGLFLRCRDNREEVITAVRRCRASTTDRGVPAAGAPRDRWSVVDSE
jgi:hypothetical protein